MVATVAAAVSVGAAGQSDARPSGLAGAYLQARHAMLNNDAPSAALYYQRALIFAPNDPVIMTPAFHFSLVVGDGREAVRIADRLLRTAGPTSPLQRYAQLASAAEAVRIGAYDDAEALLTAESGVAIAPLTRQMGLGWIAFAKGDAEQARDIFLTRPTTVDVAALEPQDRAQAAAERDNVIRAFRTFGLQQVALMETARGQDAAAAKALEEAQAAADAPSAPLALALGGSYRRIGRADEALALYEAVLAQDPDHPAVRQAREATLAGAPATVTIRDAAEGFGALLLSFARAPSDGQPEQTRAALYFAQLARHLAPDSVEARIVAAEQLAGLRQFDLAAELYGGVPESSPYAEVARIAQSEALFRIGDVDAALMTVRRIAEAGSDRPAVYLTLGGLEQAQERYGACVDAYQRALSLITEPTWRLWLRLGVCQEQSGDWNGAEESFVEALALEPKQPDVLNHFGYGLVEQGRRLDEARAMIELAVAEEPRNGYIVDSLGWVLYRLGEFEEAVVHLEKAVSLAPSEWVISDHFGDALWQVGRRMEARFQWRRALSLEPDDEVEKGRINRKLALGLDVVLNEEEEVEAGQATPDVSPGAEAELVDG